MVLYIPKCNRKTTAVALLDPEDKNTPAFEMLVTSYQSTVLRSYNLNLQKNLKYS
jgi:hypothetical protein